MDGFYNDKEEPNVLTKDQKKHKKKQDKKKANKKRGSNDDTNVEPPKISEVSIYNFF